MDYPTQCRINKNEDPLPLNRGNYHSRKPKIPPSPDWIYLNCQKLQMVTSAQRKNLSDLESLRSMVVICVPGRDEVAEDMGSLYALLAASPCVIRTLRMSGSDLQGQRVRFWLESDFTPKLTVTHKLGNCKLPTMGSTWAGF